MGVGFLVSSVVAVVAVVHLCLLRLVVGCPAG